MALVFRLLGSSILEWDRGHKTVSVGTVLKQQAGGILVDEGVVGLE